MRVLSLALAISATLALGCQKASFSKADPTATEEVASQNYPPARGSILLIDENNHPLSDYAGVKISSENANPADISITAKGEFNFPTLTNSSFPLVLTFSKTGYGTVRQYYSKTFLDSVKNQTLQAILLLPQSSVAVNSLSGTLEGTTFKLLCNISAVQEKPTNGVTFFLFKNHSEVSCDDWAGDIADSRSWTVPVTAGDNLNSFCITRTIDCPCNFLRSGDTVYLKAYGNTYSPFGNFYVSRQTGQCVFPSINTKAPSATISFVVP